MQEVQTRGNGLGELPPKSLIVYRLSGDVRVLACVSVAWETDAMYPCLADCRHHPCTGEPGGIWCLCNAFFGPPWPLGSRSGVSGRCWETATMTTGYEVRGVGKTERERERERNAGRISFSCRCRVGPCQRCHRSRKKEGKKKENGLDGGSTEEIGRRGEESALPGGFGKVGFCGSRLGRRHE
ncbi:uncharacterized protein LY79DRAFT_344727 [Colletotrichum navitas]|uniref:Uncharacterized protein n=1 Tax=Colletotrichum navitas TaxID=681940 RepID=A0AAD8V0R9_9PEZI|nr:uncharacterized protein LY79DRAFT_344727 [Colletotrichum navitas]KAK1579396.1 hypothetical protein LY79DRAFT_344727 [Colletotrichum navitas]